MKNQLIPSLIVVFILWPTCLNSSAETKKLPNIRILATGGTIAGKQASVDQVGYQAGALSANDLINAVPQMKELANLSVEQVANIGSQDMNDAIWLKLADRLNAVLADPGVDGVVITHGTDTMEETAYFLNLVTKSSKPVVLVGSMRPATAISADGPMNLYNAVAVAGDPESANHGVLVVMNDYIFFARNVTKTNTTNLDTFKSPNRGVAGVVNTGHVIFYAGPPMTLSTTQSVFSVAGLKELPKVDIVYAYANVGADLVEALVKSGDQGIILAGVGDGNATQPTLDALEGAVKQGVSVVRSSRVGSGEVVRNVEINDDKMGFIAAMDLNPQKARILLMLGLTQTKDTAKLQRYFEEY